MTVGSPYDGFGVFGGTDRPSDRIGRCHVLVGEGSEMKDDVGVVFLGISERVELDFSNPSV